jgi:hypothetical protein
MPYYTLFYVTQAKKKYIYRIFPSITRALSIQKRSLNGKKRRCALYNECALCN